MKAILLLFAWWFSCSVVFGEREFSVVTKKRESLDKIIIPSADLEEVTIQEAADFAVSRTRELDTTELDPKKKGMTVLVRFPTGEMYPRVGKLPISPRNPGAFYINYQKENIVLTDLLIEIARQTGYDLYTTSVGVVFCPPGSSPFPNFVAAKGETWEALYQVKR